MLQEIDKIKKIIYNKYIKENNILFKEKFLLWQ